MSAACRDILGTGELLLLEQFIPPTETVGLFEALRTELAWHEETLRFAGKTVPVPRLVCWYGDPGMSYRYSGIHHDPLPWHERLADLRDRIESLTERHFNSVLGNLYRHERDSIAFHADDEPELGPQPFIASLSLGTERIFKVRHNESRRIVDIPLPDGSLLLMSGNLQRDWQHAIMKGKNSLGARINLTFRTIFGKNDYQNCYSHN